MNAQGTLQRRPGSRIDQRMLPRAPGARTGSSSRAPGRRRGHKSWHLLATLALALAASQSGCSCLDCFDRCVAPLKIIPPKSALEPRNPPCSFVDPTCYGYHATCWRSWPAECDNSRDCLEWYQQDAIGMPKGETAPSLAPVPPMPPIPPIPQQPPAPAAEPPASEPRAEPEPEESSHSHVQPEADYAALPPIVRPIELPVAVRLPAEENQPHSSRRTVVGRQVEYELP